MGPLLHSEDKTLDCSLSGSQTAKVPAAPELETFYFTIILEFKASAQKNGSKERDCCNLNKPGRALEHGSKGIVMKGRGSAVPPAPPQLLTMGVFLSLWCFERLQCLAGGQK